MLQKAGALFLSSQIKEPHYTLERQQSQELALHIAHTNHKPITSNRNQELIIDRRILHTIKNRDEPQNTRILNGRPNQNCKSYNQVIFFRILSYKQVITGEYKKYTGKKREKKYQAVETPLPLEQADETNILKESQELLLKKSTKREKENPIQKAKNLHESKSPPLLKQPRNTVTAGLTKRLEKFAPFSASDHQTEHAYSIPQRHEAFLRIGRSEGRRGGPRFVGGMHISRTRNHSSASSSQTWEVKPWAQVGVLWR